MIHETKRISWKLIPAKHRYAESLLGTERRARGATGNAARCLLDPSVRYMTPREMYRSKESLEAYGPRGKSFHSPHRPREEPPKLPTLLG